MGNVSSMKKATTELLPHLFRGFLHGDLIHPIRMRVTACVQLVYANENWEHTFQFDLDQYTYGTLCKFDVFFGKPWKDLKVFPDGTWDIYYHPHQQHITTTMEIQAFLLFLWIYNLWMVPLTVLEMVALGLSTPDEGCWGQEMHFYVSHYIQQTLDIQKYDQFLDEANEINLDAFIKKTQEGFPIFSDDSCDKCAMQPRLFELFLRAAWADDLRRKFIQDELFRTILMRKKTYPFEEQLFHVSMDFTMNGDDANDYGGCLEEEKLLMSHKYHFKIMEMFKMKVLDELSEFLDGKKVPQLENWNINTKVYFDGPFRLHETKVDEEDPSARAVDGNRYDA